MTDELVPIGLLNGDVSDRRGACGIGMLAVPLIAAMLAPAMLNAGPVEIRWPAPVLTELSDEYRRPLGGFEKGADVREGYFLDGLKLLPGGKSLVGELIHLRQHRREAIAYHPFNTIGSGTLTYIGLIAVDVATGDARLLRPPSAGADSTVEFVLDPLVMLAGDVCAVPVRRRARNAPETETIGTADQVLWGWDVERDAIYPLGRWVPVHRLANALDLKTTCLWWEPTPSRNWDGKTVIRDRLSGRDLPYRLDPDELYADPQVPWAVAAEWYGPAAGAAAFVACESRPGRHGGAPIRCFDAHATRGIRWSVSAERIQSALEGVAVDVVPVFTPGWSHTELPVLVAVQGRDAPPHVFVVIIDTRDGEFVRVLPLPELRFAPTFTPVISADAQLLVYRDRDADTLSDRFKLLDLATGNIIGDYDCDAHFPGAEALAITAHHTLLASDGAEVRELSLRQNDLWRARVVFSLAGNGEDSR